MQKQKCVFICTTEKCTIRCGLRSVTLKIFLASQMRHSPIRFRFSEGHWRMYKVLCVCATKTADVAERTLVVTKQLKQPQANHVLAANEIVDSAKSWWETCCLTTRRILNAPENAYSFVYTYEEFSGWGCTETVTAKMLFKLHINSIKYIITEILNEFKFHFIMTGSEKTMEFI